MEQTHALLLTLLRAALWRGTLPAAPFAACSGEEWQRLYRLACRQGVDAVVWDAVSQLPGEVQPPRTLRVQWAVQTGRIEQRYARQERAIAAMAALFRSHGIRLMLLKGYGLSLCYPVPAHRPCGDVDIWLHGEQQRADDVLRRERRIEVDGSHHHHTVFTFDGVMVENHYDFLNVHAHRSNRRIEKQLRRLAEAGEERIRVLGEPVELPSADCHALFLLRHAAAHFAAAELSLRHAADWALFVHRCHAAIDWEALERTAREMNMHRFLHCLQAIATDALGTPAAELPPFERDEALEQRVLNEILQPEFAEPWPRRGALRILRFKFRRWWANRWKHRIVYREGLLSTFVVQLWSHLLKPKSLIH